MQLSGTAREASPARPAVHYTGIEGLRACAAIAVAFAHAMALKGSYDVPGPIWDLTYLALHGVTLFFCLSGFLLYAPFVRATVVGARRPDAATFYRHRLLRIYPAYAVIFVVTNLLLASVVNQAAPYGELPGARTGRLTDPWLFLANLGLVQGYFPHGLLTGLSVSWSLLPELVFYALVPLLALAGYRLARRTSGVLAMALPAVALVALGWFSRAVDFANVAGPGGVAGATYRTTGASWSAVFHHSFPVQADLFGYGMLAAVAVALVTSPDASTRVVRRFRVVARIALFAGLFLVLALPVQVFIPTYLGVTFAGLIALVTGPKTRTSRGLVSLLERRPVVYLGRVSYSIYLWHFPIVIFLTDRFAEATTAWGLVVRVAVVLAVTVILSSITYRYVEAPAMRLARRLGSRRRDLELVGATS